MLWARITAGINQDDSIGESVLVYTIKKRSWHFCVSFFFFFKPFTFSCVIKMSSVARTASELLHFRRTNKEIIIKMKH